MALPLQDFWFLSASDDSEHDASHAREAEQGVLRTRALPSSVPAEDAEDVLRVRSGDADAFRAIYLAQYQSCWELAYGYLHSESAAEDVVHDVFLSVWRDRGTWWLRGSIKGYFLGAVRNKALNVLRHERVVRNAATQHASAGDTDAMGEQTLRPDEAASADDLEQVLRQVIATMPPLRRDVMMLRWRQDLSIPEIAAALGISANAVSIHLTRAREALLPVMRTFGTK